LGIGDWGLGIGDWGLGPIPNPQFNLLVLNIFLLNKNNNFFEIIKRKIFYEIKYKE
jgi:hypothetical protein